MNVPKKLIGHMVEITWKDPNSWRGSLSEMLKGRASLATWKEYGVLLDVTDGVAIVAHSLSQNPGAKEPDEVSRTAIDESLIEAIVVFQPESQA